MQLTDLFAIADDRRFLLAGTDVLSRADILSIAHDLASELEVNPSFDRSGFWVIDETQAEHFFPMLLAVWIAGGKAVLPNRDWVCGKPSFNFHLGKVCIESGKVVLELNPNRVECDLPSADDVVCFSSGSTGDPKGVLHSHGNFLLNARSTAQLLGLSDVRSVTPLSPYLVSAVSHFLVHWITNSELAFVSMDKVHESFPRLWEECPRRALIGSPMHLAHCIQYMPDGCDPEYFFTSGDFMYPSNIRRILEGFPNARYFYVYGLAELAGRYFINCIDHDTPTESLDSLGETIDDTGFQVDNDELVASSVFLYSGYIERDRFKPRVGDRRTGDRVRWEDGRLKLNGRTNDEVKIGGNKVSIKRIEAKVAECLDGLPCAIFVTSHKRFGTLLSLAVESSTKLDRQILLSNLRRYLDAHELPQALYYVDEIPVTQSQKIDRIALAERVPSLRTID